MEEQNSIYLQRLCAAVKQVQIEASQTNEYLVRDGRSPLQLCGRYEDIFCHRFKLSPLGMLKRKPGFWGVVKEISRKEALTRIKNLQHAETDLGRCRAWIRLAANENSLVAYIIALQSNPDLLAKYYEPQSFLRDTDLSTAAINVLSGLDMFRFDLTIDTSSLEVEIAPDAYIPADKISRIMALELAKAIHQQSDPVLIERKPLRKKRKKPKNFTSQSPDTDSPDLPDSESDYGSMMKPRKTSPLLVGNGCSIKPKVGFSSSFEQPHGTLLNDSGFHLSIPLHSESRGFGLSISAPGPGVIISKVSTGNLDTNEFVSNSLKQIDEISEVIAPCIESEPQLSNSPLIPNIEPIMPLNDTKAVIDPIMPLNDTKPVIEPIMPLNDTKPVIEPIMPLNDTKPVIEPIMPQNDNPPDSLEHIFTPNPPITCLTEDQKEDFTAVYSSPAKLKSELKLNLYIENEPQVVPQTVTSPVTIRNQELSDTDLFLPKSVSEPDSLEGAQTNYRSIENSPILELTRSHTNYKDFPSPFNPNPSLAHPIQTYLTADAVRNEISSRNDTPNSISANSHSSSDEFFSINGEWDIICLDDMLNTNSVVQLETTASFQDEFHDDYFMKEISPDKLNLNEVYSTMRRVKEELKSLDSSHPSYKILVHTLVKLRIRKVEIDEGKVSSKQKLDNQIKIFGHILIIQTGKNQTNPCEICGKSLTPMTKNKWSQCIECSLVLHVHCIKKIPTICPIQSDPKLILDITPEVGLLVQKFKCKNCSRQIGLSCRDQPQLCRYSGYYYCINCYSVIQIALPSKIVHNWDFTPRGVSLSAYLTLKILYTFPTIDLTQENPLIYSYENTLSECGNIREKLRQMNLFLSVCNDAKELGLLTVHQGILHDHIWKGKEPWSIEDLYFVRDGGLLQILKDFLTNWDKHIRQCPCCSGNGHVCLVCKSEDIIFPWDMLAISCKSCGMLSHSNCTTQDGCSRCNRRARRMENISK